MRASLNRMSLLLGVMAVVGLSACGNTVMTDEEMQEKAQTAKTQELTSLGSCTSQGYGACTNWSSWYQTGVSCTYSQYCMQCVRVQTLECQRQIDPTPECCLGYEPGPMLQDSYERYRVCFNPTGGDCTEYEHMGFETCGC